jgi:hypothetical protein
VVQLERDAHAAVAARAAQLRLRRRVATQQEGVLLWQRLNAWLMVQGGSSVGVSV